MKRVSQSVAGSLRRWIFIAVVAVLGSITVFQFEVGPAGNKAVVGTALVKPALADEAGDGAWSWQVVNVTGSARYRKGRGFFAGWREVAVGLAVEAKGQIETGADGRVVMSNGHDLVTVSPGSRIELPPSATDNPAEVTIVQTVGKVRYKVESRRLPTSGLGKRLGRALLATQRYNGRFTVETPYLIAGVKGTGFEVNVTAETASVSVDEGVVGVSAANGAGGEVDVTPGQTASASSGVAAGAASISVTAATATAATSVTTAVGTPSNVAAASGRSLASSPSISGRNIGSAGIGAGSASVSVTATAATPNNATSAPGQSPDSNASASGIGIGGGNGANNAGNESGSGSGGSGGSGGPGGTGASGASGGNGGGSSGAADAAAAASEAGTASVSVSTASAPGPAGVGVSGNGNGIGNGNGNGNGNGADNGR